MALPTAPRVNWSQMQLNLSGAWHQTRAIKKQGPDVASKPLVQWRSSIVRLPGCIQFCPSQDGVFESTFAKESWLLSPLQVDFGQVWGWALLTDARLLSDERIELCSSRLGMKPTAGQPLTSGSLRPWSYVLRSESSVQIFSTKC